MPRRSAADLATATVLDVGRARLLPRVELPPAERDAFSRLVGSVAPDHFREPDRLLLEQLARALVIADTAAAELERQGLLVDGTPNPLVRVVREQSRLVASLATKLRLTVQARASKERAAATTNVDPVTLVDFTAEAHGMADVETMLAELFEDRWPEVRGLYELNQALRLRPWWPPLPIVWRRRNIGCGPEMAGTAYASAWPDAEALVRKLHEQYVAATNNSDD